MYLRWSHDGKELDYIAPDARLMAVSIRATATTIAGVPSALFRAHFLVNAEAGAAPPPLTLLMHWGTAAGR